MTFIGPAKDITALLEENKEEINNAIKLAATGYDKFISLLDIDRVNEEYNRNVPGAEKKSEKLQYVIDMIETYITSGPDQSKRREEMQVFADNFQRPFSEVKEVLDYLDLDI